MLLRYLAVGVFREMCQRFHVSQIVLKRLEFL